MAENDQVHHGSCYCGAVKVSVEGPPAAAAYCHCQDCRKWHSAPINAWSIWPDAKVQIDGPVITSTVSEQSRRVSCKKCGGCVANLKPAVNMTVIYPMTLAGPEATFRFDPQFHIFYNERVMDVSDGLPKFIDMPKPFGGSGETAEEPQRRSPIPHPPPHPPPSPPFPPPPPPPSPSALARPPPKRSGPP